MRPVDERVAELLERIREGALPDRARRPNELNEERVEAFIRQLDAHPGRGRLTVVRQELPWSARRTTRMNYVFEVAGRNPDVLLLVAHYDTWGGPGADDNTTGEEILKQYLLHDLAREEPPPFTRVYFLAGSEECGLIGLFSQLILAGLFWSAALSLETGNLVAAGVAVGLAPLLKYRFGVAGSRHYVRSLPRERLERIRAVLSVDSVGEGKLYFPTTTLGADFFRALLPYAGHDGLDDLLKEIAHCRGIRYNTYLAGGTTDHLSFLEVNRSFPRVVAETFKKLGCALARRPYRPPFTIPASAIIAMCPGKASAFVYGGKIHTRQDTADRVYPQPLRETLLVLDDFFDRFEHGSRPRQPREVADCHYARLYALSDGRALAALKDAVEPNRRNVNLLCAGRFDEASGTLEVDEIADWGTEVRLDREVREYARAHGLRWRRRKVDRLTVRHGGSQASFARGSWGTLRAIPSAVAGVFEHLLGTFSFAAMFVAAYLLGQAVNALFLHILPRWPVTADLLHRHVLFFIILSLLLQLVILIRLFTHSFPTWIDNAYKNLNRADNLRSLKRVKGDS